MSEVEKVEGEYLEEADRTNLPPFCGRAVQWLGQQDLVVRGSNSAVLSQYSAHRHLAHLIEVLCHDLALEQVLQLKQGWRSYW